jgi:hypothetical protein
MVNFVITSVGFWNCSAVLANSSAVAYALVNTGALDYGRDVHWQRCRLHCDSTHHEGQRTAIRDCATDRSTPTDYNSSPEPLRSATRKPFAEKIAV